MRQETCWRKTLGSSIRVVTGFSPLTGDMEYRQTVAGSTTPIQDLAYDWDGNGNLETRRDMARDSSRSSITTNSPADANRDSMEPRT
jgi:YD repeat-containing protein